MFVQQFHERVGVKLFQIENAGFTPCTIEHKCGPYHGRHAGGVADGLTADLGKARLVVAHIMEVDRARLTGMFARYNTADACFSGGCLS